MRSLPSMVRLTSCTTIAAALVLSAPAVRADDQPNHLSKEEIREGNIMLFDGQTTFGWKIEGDGRVENGALVLGGEKSTVASTTTAFGALELEFDYRTDSRGATLVLGDRSHELQPKPDWSDEDFDFHGRSRTHVTFRVPAGQRLYLRSIYLEPKGLKSIFNGKNLDGWYEVPGRPAKYSVTASGELNVKNGPGEIKSEGEWQDFVLQLDIISNGKHLNSGVFYRCLPGPKPGQEPPAGQDLFWQGYETQVRNQWKDDDRTQPVDFGTGGIYNLQPARKVVSSDHEWFTMTTIAHGPHIATWINGYQTADHVDTRPPSETARKGTMTGKGCISLQGHDPTTDLSFRNIRVVELPPAKGEGNAAK